MIHILPRGATDPTFGGVAGSLRAGLVKTSPSKEIHLVAYVYIVVGNTGEFDDFRDWYVKAFLSEPEAEKLCQRLNGWCLQYQCHENTPAGDRWSRWETPDLCPEEDPRFEYTNTGTSYFVHFVELD